MDLEGIVKQASATDLNKAAALLETIRAENPKLWPNGLTVDHFSPGNLWLIQKSAADEPVGFVGWQARKVEGVPTGYYSIGVLPEYRHQGIAKKAVSQLLATKAASVEGVRALIVPGNTGSERLARSLDVPVEKAAGFWSGLASVARSPYTAAALGGYLTPVLQDNNMHPDEPFDWNPYNSGDKGRNIMAAVNTALGATGGYNMSSGIGKMHKALSPMDFAKATGQAGAGVSGMLIYPIAKDLQMHSHKAIEGVDRLSKTLPQAILDASKAQKVEGAAGGLGTKGTLGAAALLALAIGGGAYGISRALSNQKGDQQQAAGGRIKVTLPTKNPTDAETTVDLPFDQISALSPALRQRIERDTRRRLYGETNARTRRIGTQPLTAVA